MLQQQMPKCRTAGTNTHLEWFYSRFGRDVHSMASIICPLRAVSMLRTEASKHLAGPEHILCLWISSSTLNEKNNNKKKLETIKCLDIEDKTFFLLLQYGEFCV